MIDCLQWCQAIELILQFKLSTLACFKSMGLTLKLFFAEGSLVSKHKGRIQFTVEGQGHVNPDVHLKLTCLQRLHLNCESLYCCEKFYILIQ